LLDGAERRRIERLGHDELRLGDRQAGHLIQRHLRSIRVNMDAVENRDPRPTGAYAAGLVLQGIDPRLHALGHFGVQPFKVTHVHWWLRLEGSREACCRANVGYAVTSDPIGSPVIARLMLPGVRRLKTTIGRRLSMQSEMAVASITFSPCSSTWRYEIRSKRVALAFTIGSAS